MENEVTIIRLLFEDKDHLKNVSECIEKDRAFLCSLLQLTGCKEVPKEFELKLGLIKKK